MIQWRNPLSMCLYSRRLNDSSHCASSSLSSNKIKVHLCNREARTTVLIVDALLSNHAAFRRVICQNKRAQVWIKPRTGGSSPFKQPAETPVPQLQAERERSVSLFVCAPCAGEGGKLPCVLQDNAQWDPFLSLQSRQQGLRTPEVFIQEFVHHVGISTNSAQGIITTSKDCGTWFLLW